MNTGSDDAGSTAVAEGEAQKKPERRLGSRAPQFIRRSRTLHLSWQVGVFVVGLAVVVAGVLMLALPGPGWLVIFAGMAIWSTEFVWAQPHDLLLEECFGPSAVIRAASTVRNPAATVCSPAAPGVTGLA
ncbi:TIGR02611 family protein, partial [Streptomyces albidoflavus]